MPWTVVTAEGVYDLVFTRKGAVGPGGYRVMVGDTTIGWVHHIPSNPYYGWTAQSATDTSRPARGFRTRRYAAEHLLRMNGLWPWM